MPESSPREMNGAFASAIFVSAVRRLDALRLRRDRRRADDHEVVVHHRAALDALARGHHLLLGGRRVGEDDVGLPARAHLDRLAAAHRDRLDLAAALLLEGRDEDVEQARSPACSSWWRGSPAPSLGGRGHRRRRRSRPCSSEHRGGEHLSRSVVHQSGASYDVRDVPRYRDIAERAAGARRRRRARARRGAAERARRRRARRARRRRRSAAPTPSSRARACSTPAPRRAARVARDGALHARARAARRAARCGWRAATTRCSTASPAAPSASARRGSFGGLTALWQRPRRRRHAAPAPPRRRATTTRSPPASSPAAGRSSSTSGAASRGSSSPRGNPRGITRRRATSPACTVALRADRDRHARAARAPAARGGRAIPRRCAARRSPTHLEAALAVAAGLADAAVGLRAAAATVGLEFVPARLGAVRARAARRRRSARRATCSPRSGARRPCRVSTCRRAAPSAASEVRPRHRRVRRR